VGEVWLLRGREGFVAIRTKEPLSSSPAESNEFKNAYHNLKLKIN
jgi:hypothetical protein